MSEELKEKQSEEYQFINEKIVPKKKKKWLKKLWNIFERVSIFFILMDFVSL